MSLFKRKRIHPVRDQILIGLIFLAAVFTIVFLLHALWEAATATVN